MAGEQVECRSDSRYAERPVALTWQGERLEVSQVLEHWRTPQGWSFRVCTSTELVFLLVYDETRDTWQVIAE